MNAKLFVIPDKVYTEIGHLSWNELGKKHADMVIKLEAMERLANEFAVHRSYCSTQSNNPGQRQLPLKCDCGYEVALHLAAARKE